MGMQIDFHAHILPRADHGSLSLACSLQQVSQAQEAGIDLLVATPHFYPQHDDLDEFLERRERTNRELLTALEGKKAPKILVGAEVHLQRGLEHLDKLEQLCVQGTDILLLELPPKVSIRQYEQTLDDLLYEKKLQIVLAHIDRYDPGIIDTLMDLGCYGQLNAEPFCRILSRTKAMTWAGCSRVVAFGSDIHGVGVGYKDFLAAKKRMGEDYDCIMERCEAFLEERRR